MIPRETEFLLTILFNAALYRDDILDLFLTKIEESGITGVCLDFCSDTRGGRDEVSSLFSRTHIRDILARHAIRTYVGMNSPVASDDSSVREAFDGLRFGPGGITGPFGEIPVWAVGKALLFEISDQKRIDIFTTIKELRLAPDGREIALLLRNENLDRTDLSGRIAMVRRTHASYRDLAVRTGCSDEVTADEALLNFYQTAALGAGATLFERTFRFASDGPGSIDLFDAKVEGYRHFIDLTRHVRPRPAYPGVKAYGSALPLRGRRPVQARAALPAAGILITARTASTRLPGKALIRICNKETVALLIERMKRCSEARMVVLCTTMRPDDDALAMVGRREGVEVFRGADDNVAERLLSAAETYHLDHLVRITGDDILKCIDLVDEAITSHLEKKADYTYMRNVFYGGESEVISTRALSAVVERAEEPENTEYLSWYLDDDSVFRTNVIDAPDRYWRGYRLTLDTPQDLAVLEAVYNHLYRDGEPVDALSALAWLDRHPEIASMNASVAPKLTRDQINCNLRL